MQFIRFLLELSQTVLFNDNTNFEFEFEFEFIRTEPIEQFNVTTDHKHKKY